MTNILLLTTTTTLLFLFLSPPPISSYTTTTTATNVVVDFLGNPVEAGSKYYLIYSGVGYFFGSLTLFSKPNHLTNCPQYVAMSPNPSDFGPGVEFWPDNPTQKTISLSSDINIAFAGSTNCTEKPVWRLVNDKNMNNGSYDDSYIITDGILGDRNINNSWFKIEKVDDRFSPISLYKIRYCPSSSNNSMCGYLGLSYDKLSNVTLSLDAQHENPEVYFWPANLKPTLPTKGGLLWG